MITAHEKIRAGQLLPTAPFELLFDQVCENVIVTWPDLASGLSLVVNQRWSVPASALEAVILTGACPEHAWVLDRLGPDRWREIDAAVAAVYDDHRERQDRVAEIYRVLEGEL